MDGPDRQDKKTKDRILNALPRFVLRNAVTCNAKLGALFPSMDRVGWIKGWNKTSCRFCLSMFENLKGIREPESRLRAFQEGMLGMGR